MERVNSLRLKHQWTWEETAKQIDLSRTMLHFIKTGKHSVTDKVLHRLEKLEREAGLRVLTPAIQDDFWRQQFGKYIRQNIKEKTEEQAQEYVLQLIRTAQAELDKYLEEMRERTAERVTKKEIEQGRAEVVLEYKRGKPKAGWPTKLELKRPPFLDAEALLEKIDEADEYWLAVEVTLPSEFATDEFYNRLTPDSCNQIQKTAFALIFGLDWRKRVRWPEKM